MLYHSDTPVISVEQGTSFGLIKMLYESIRGYGQIIGLRQRESASTLTCIITQDQTILTEREYDIILHGKLVVGFYVIQYSSEEFPEDICYTSRRDAIQFLRKMARKVKLFSKNIATLHFALKI